MPESPSDGIRLVAINPSLAMVYKQARLLALADSPSAFCSAYAEEFQHPDSVWIERSDDDHDERIGFLALRISTGEPVGMVRCFRSERDPSCAVVISLWIDSSCRGTGLGARLLSAITQWAVSHGFSDLQLLVTNNNTRAIRFYERSGFVRTGRVEPYPNDSTLHQIEMSQPLKEASLLQNKKSQFARWAQLLFGLLLLQIGVHVGHRGGTYVGIGGVLVLLYVCIFFIRQLVGQP